MQTILNQISVLRRSCGFSHEYIAHELNISQPAYSKIENGKTQLTVERLFKIAEILNVPVSELLKEKIAGQPVHNPSSRIFFDKIVQVKDELIRKQEEEIEFLRKMIIEKKQL